jgi:hypothetical protein
MASRVHPFVHDPHGSVLLYDGRRRRLRKHTPSPYAPYIKCALTKGEASLKKKISDMTPRERNQLRDLYRADEQAQQFLVLINQQYQKTIGTKREKKAHAEKRKAKADAKEARNRLMNAAIDILGVCPEAFYPEMLHRVKEALEITPLS